MSGIEESEEQLTLIIEYLRGISPDHTDIGPDTELIESGYLDSLGIVALVAFAEDTFDTEIPEDDFRVTHFASARTVSELVTNSRSAQAASR